MSQSEEIRVFATLTAQAGKESALRDVLTQLVSLSKTEPGCLHYMLHESPDHPGTFSFFESYKDQSAVDTHKKSPYLAAAFDKAGPLLSVPPNIIMTKLIAGS
jgi:quinol monooxygenase YgiN